MAQLAQKTEQAQEAGNKVDAQGQIASIASIAASTLLHGRQIAIFESIFYAAKAAAAFAAQDYWAGAEFLVASGLFAEAAGTTKKSAMPGADRLPELVHTMRIAAAGADTAEARVPGLPTRKPWHRVQVARVGGLVLLARASSWCMAASIYTSG